MARLTVIAKFTAKPGRENQVRADLLGMVAPSRRDEGNLDYDILASSDDPRVFFTYENWTGQPALDKHMRTPHFQRLEEAFKEALAQPMEIHLLTQAEPTAE